MVSPKRPKFRITRWMRIRRFFYELESPLRLRTSLIRLGHRNKRPFLALLRLFLPLPTWHFRVPEPVPFKTMLNNVPLLASRMNAADLNNMYSTPIWRARDTPLRSLYRIYEVIAARQLYAIGSEVEYFWHQSRRSWAIDRIPDPYDNDPVRYALLAAIAEQLAHSFNWRMSIGMRRDRRNIYRETMDDELPPFTPIVAPAWTQNVPAVDPTWITDLPDDMLDSSGKLVLEVGGETSFYLERNIIFGGGDFYTV